ncbi:four helix bundle protein [Echinicola jeungdonensis]|uniref:four helix bundle protein n=1 Tax=Echinicola jeungdonensis TaxID=709343 RepID=UPI0025B53B5D|nr:four helix bundle protein [Echinicola jeungdonensis]MDN3669103.1 four helix bundle protein [Echinicola jeungdonensis]
MDLKVWKRSIFLAKDIYVLTANFPNEERFGLTSQLGRASVSIAEGAERRSVKDLKRFLDISYRSLCELENQLCLSNLSKLIGKEKFQSLEIEINEIQKMSYALMNSIKTEK